MYTDHTTPPTGGSATPAQPRVAIVGSGIAGLAAAHTLQGLADVTLFEANDYAGGHSNTIDVSLDGIDYPVDTGFLVHNDRTYPNLIRLLPLLGVETPNSDMTFSVSLPASNLEWAGANLATLFAQPLNLVRPAFWRMVKDILRFNRESTDLLDRVRGSGLSLADLLDQGGYSSEFRSWYLYPMGAAIWSSPLKGMEAFVVFAGGAVDLVDQGEDAVDVLVAQVGPFVEGRHEPRERQPGRTLIRVVGQSHAQRAVAGFAACKHGHATFMQGGLVGGRFVVAVAPVHPGAGQVGGIVGRGVLCRRMACIACTKHDALHGCEWCVKDGSAACRLAI